MVDFALLLPMPDFEVTEQQPPCSYFHLVGLPAMPLVVPKQVDVKTNQKGDWNKYEKKLAGLYKIYIKRNKKIQQKIFFDKITENTKYLSGKRHKT